MDLLRLITLTLPDQRLSSDERSRLDREMERLVKYLRRLAHRWPKRIQPNEQDLEDLAQEVLLRLTSAHRSTDGPRELQPGFLYVIALNVMRSFYRGAQRKLDEHAAVMDDDMDSDEAMGNAVPQQSLRSQAAVHERMRSNVRLEATRAMGEISARLNLEKPNDLFLYELMTLVLLLAVEDPLSPTKELYQLAEKELKQQMGKNWRNRQFINARRKLERRPSMRLFLDARAAEVLDQEQVPQSTLWSPVDKKSKEQIKREHHADGLQCRLSLPIDGSAPTPPADSPPPNQGED